MLYGKKIDCIPLGQKDSEFVLSLRNLPEIAQELFSDAPTYDFIHQKWLSSFESSNLYFIITEKDLSKVGVINFTNVSYRHQKGEYGVAILPGYQGKGYAYEASMLMISYIFINLPIQKIYLRVFSENLSAIRLYQKLGFQREGLLVKEFLKGGIYRDVVVMALFKENFVL